MRLAGKAVRQVLSHTAGEWLWILRIEGLVTPIELYTRKVSAHALFQRTWQ